MQTDISYWHTTAKDRNNWLKKHFVADENASVLIILATTVHKWTNKQSVVNLYYIW